jgi:putative addiction module CopG family antidote
MMGLIAMSKATLTISMPKLMREFIEGKVRGGRFSTPSEYIRSLIRSDQDLFDAAVLRPAAAAKKRAARTRTKIER